MLLHACPWLYHACSSKVTHRGTFSGIAEKLDYLQEIGITTVELQPVYEFDETPEEVNKKTSADIVATAGENGGELPGYRVLNYWGYREGFIMHQKLPMRQEKMQRWNSDNW